MAVEKITVTFVGGEVVALEYALSQTIKDLKEGSQPDMAHIYEHMMTKVSSAKAEGRTLGDDY